MEKGTKKRKATAKLDAIAHRAWIEIVLEEIASYPEQAIRLHTEPVEVWRTNWQGPTVVANIEIGGTDALRAEYRAWKTLKIHAPRLGGDPKIRTIATTEEWWNEKIKVYTSICLFFLSW